MRHDRPQRLGAALKKEISQMIHDELKDPRIGFVTILDVDVSPDLKNAKVIFSVLGNEKAKKNALAGLKSSISYIQHLLGERLALRFIPKIRFSLDTTEEEAMHIEELLNKIKQEREERGDE
ncbi:MAG: 30S ribosome-binding factor RbfA [Candidatus Omnitrophota bacterium]